MKPISNLDCKCPEWRYGVLAALALRLLTNDTPQARRALAYMTLTLLADDYSSHEVTYIATAAEFDAQMPDPRAVPVVYLRMLAVVQTGERHTSPVSKALFQHHMTELRRAKARVRATVRATVREDERIGDLFRQLDRNPHNPVQ